MEAYIYAQRPLQDAPARVKVGSHTGAPEKLWSRYATYHGTQQEFKLCRVEACAVQAFERYVQAHLRREGHWIENELFLAKAWDAFDALARQCILKPYVLLHVSKHQRDFHIKPVALTPVPSRFAVRSCFDKVTASNDLRSWRIADY